MPPPNTSIASLLSALLWPLLLADGFQALRRREYRRRINRIEQRVLLEGRGVNGARSTYLVYYATHACRPPSLTGYVAGARLANHPWDLSSTEAATRALHEIASQVAQVVLPWMRATSTLDGFARVLHAVRGVHPQPLYFEQALNATLRESLAEARTLLGRAISGPLPFWAGSEGPARQLLESIEAGCYVDLLSKWEGFNTPREASDA